MATTPLPPTNFTLLNFTSASILLSWQPGNGGRVDYFIINYSPSDIINFNTTNFTNTLNVTVSPRSQNVSSRDTFNQEVSNLTPGVNYSVTLFAVSYGIHSNHVEIFAVTIPLPVISV
ncbi:unnamed protein product, partial [Owenia fusiformis]